MSSCLIRGLRSAELAVTNLEEAARFYETVWNLTPVAQNHDAHYFRGSAGYHHILGVHRGPQPAVVRFTFDVANRADVETLHKAVTAAGCAATAPAMLKSAGGGYGFGCKDPDGRNLAFVCEVKDHANHADQADKPRKIVHANLNTRDHDATIAFFTRVLGFAVYDENEPLTFLHCDNSDHCSVVMCKMGLPTLNHIAFDVPDIDSVMRGMGRMKDAGYPIEWGPGRHGPGNNVFAYFCGPDEVPLEYAADVLQVDDSYQPHDTKYWKYNAGRSELWGVTAPRSPRYYRVQRLFGYTEDGWKVS